MCEYMITIALKSAPNEVLRARSFLDETWDEVEIQQVNQHLLEYLKGVNWSIWRSFEEPDNVSFSVKNDDILCLVVRRLKDDE